MVLMESDWYWYSKGVIDGFARRLAEVTRAKLVFVIEGDDGERVAERRVGW